MSQIHRHTRVKNISVTLRWRTLWAHDVKTIKINPQCGWWDIFGQAFVVPLPQSTIKDAASCSNGGKQGPVKSNYGGTHYEHVFSYELCSLLPKYHLVLTWDRLLFPIRLEIPTVWVRASPGDAVRTVLQDAPGGNIPFIARYLGIITHFLVTPLQPNACMRSVIVNKRHERGLCLASGNESTVFSK